MKRLFPLTIVCACVLLCAASPRAHGAGHPDPTQPAGDWLRQAPIQLFTATLGWDPVTHDLLAIGRSLGDDEASVWAWSANSDWRRLLMLGEDANPQYVRAAFDSRLGRIYVLKSFPIDATRLLVVETAPTAHTAWLGEQFAPLCTPYGLFLDSSRGRLIAVMSSVDPARPFDLWERSVADTGAWRVLRSVPASGCLGSFAPLVLDAARSRLVWQKSHDCDFTAPLDTTLALPLEGDGGWEVLSERQVPRPGAVAAVVDTLRDRLVLTFASDTGDPLHPTHVEALDLSGGGGWTALPDPGPISMTFGMTAAADGQDLWALGAPQATTLLRLSSGPASQWEVQNHLPAPPPDADRGNLLADPFGHRLIDLTRPDGGTPDATTRLTAWAAPMGVASGWAPLEVANTAPPFVRGASVIVDPYRRRALAFGGERWSGEPSSDVWALSLSGPARWSLVETAGEAPSARSSAMAVFDPVADRMIVLGGTPLPGSWSADAWELQLDGPPTWRRLAVRDSLPDGVPTDYRALRDPADGRIHVLPAIRGAWFATLVPGDTCAWTWSDRPKPWNFVNVDGAVLYDPIGRRMIVNGGMDWYRDGGFNAAWAGSTSDTATWASLQPTGQKGPCRAKHSIAYDPIGDQMVVGGTAGDPSIWLLQWNRPERAAPWAIAADGAGVHLDWFAKGPPGLAFLVQRRTPTEPWTTLGTSTATGEHVTWSDAAVRTGERYGYRLAWPSGGDTLWCEESWTYGPAATGAVALAGAWPNPSRGQAVTLAFTLADASGARLELFDITGRRVWSRAAGGAVGRQLVTIDASLHPGVYLARVTQGARRATARIVVVK